LNCVEVYLNFNYNYNLVFSGTEEKKLYCFDYVSH